MVQCDAYRNDNFEICLLVWNFHQRKVFYRTEYNFTVVGTFRLYEHTQMRLRHTVSRDRKGDIDLELAKCDR